MRYLIVPALALAALAGSAAAETSSDLSGVTAVESSGRFQVEITQGAQYQLEITGPDASHIETEIHGRTLKLRDNRMRWPGGNIPQAHAIVRITIPRLESASVSRGGTMRATNLRAANLALNVSMGSDLTAEGSCSNLTVEASMGASLNAANLDCAAVSVEASMGASAHVRGTQSVSVEGSMGADVRVSGNPQARSQRTSMGAGIRYN